MLAGQQSSRSVRGTHLQDNMLGSTTPTRGARELQTKGGEEIVKSMQECLKVMQECAKGLERRKTTLGQ